MTRPLSARLFLWGLIVTVIGLLLRLFAGQLLLAFVNQPDGAELVSWIGTLTQLTLTLFGPLLVGVSLLARLIESDPDSGLPQQTGFRPPLLSSRQVLWWGIAVTAASVLAVLVSRQLPAIRSVDPAVSTWVIALSAVNQLTLVEGPLLVVLSPVARLVERQKRSRTDAFVHFRSAQNDTEEK
jgi:hypothetical protein